MHLGRGESARIKTAEGFADLVQQRRREVEAAGGEEDCCEDDVVEVEAPAATAAPLAKKARKARKSKIWNPVFDLMLARQGDFFLAALRGRKVVDCVLLV